MEQTEAENSMERLKRLVLYIIWKTGSYPDFGATKLNKVLWFVDSRAYEKYQKSITGTTYIKKQHGPVPKEIEKAKQELKQQGVVESRKFSYFNKEVNKLVTFQCPNLSLFNYEEIGLVDWWIRYIAEEHTASSISEKSHDYAWDLAEMNEEIPLYAVFTPRIRHPKEDELTWAKAEARRLGLS